MKMKRNIRKKFCIRTQHKCRKHLDAQDVTWQGSLRPDDACQHTCRYERDPPCMRTRQKWAAHWPSGCSSSGHPTSRCSWHGICLPDEESQGIFLPDGECQGIFLPDAAVSSEHSCVFWTELCLLNAALSEQMAFGRRVSRHHDITVKLAVKPQHINAASSRHSDSI
jgi:hypothetical protein